MVIIRSEKENYAIITDILETEFKEIYGDVLKQYESYVIMTLEIGEVIFESHRNDWKHLKCQTKYGCDYSTSDEGRRFNAQRFEEQFCGAKGVRNVSDGYTVPIPSFSKAT